MSRETKIRVVGKKHFGPKIDITDPCYDRDTWCRMNDVSIKEGEYTCMVSESTCDAVFNGKPHQYKVIESIAISLSGKFPAETQSTYFGEIGVDAGLAGFFNNKPDYTDPEWDSFCDRLNQPKENVWLQDVGFFSTTGHGDGSYTVFADRDSHNDIVSLVIEFRELDDWIDEDDCYF